MLTDASNYVHKHIFQINAIWPSPYSELDTQPQHMGSQQPVTMHCYRCLQQSYSLSHWLLAAQCTDFIPQGSVYITTSQSVEIRIAGIPTAPLEGHQSV